MKTGVSSYSFHKLLEKGTLKLDEIPALLPKWARCRGVCRLRNAAGQRIGICCHAEKRCQEAGVTIACYAVGGNMLADDFEASIAQYKAHVDVAAAMGAPLLRHDLAHGPVPERGIRTYEDALPILVKGVRAVADYAQSKGIRTTTENHGYFFPGQPARGEACLGRSPSELRFAGRHGEFYVRR